MSLPYPRPGERWFAEDYPGHIADVWRTGFLLTPLFALRPKPNIRCVNAAPEDIEEAQRRIATGEISVMVRGFPVRAHQGEWVVGFIRFVEPWDWWQIDSGQLAHIEVILEI